MRQTIRTQFDVSRQFGLTIKLCACRAMSRSPRRFRPFRDHHRNEHDGETDHESDSLSVPLDPPMSPDSDISSRVSSIGVDTPLWMASAVACRIQLANLRGESKEFQYHFDKGQDDVTMGNLAAKIKKALVISRIGQIQYCVGVTELKFTDDMLYASLRRWIYNMDQGPNPIVVIQWTKPTRSRSRMS